MNLPDYNRRARLITIMQSRWKEKQELFTWLRQLIKNDISSIQISQDNSIIHIKDGRKFYWDTGQFHSLGTLMRDGSIEPLESEFLQTLIAPGDTLIDIGANFGWFTTLFSTLTGTSGKVISFEPLPEMYQELQLNIELNGLDNVVAERVALSDYSGDSVLGYPGVLGPEFASIDEKYDVDEYVSFPCSVNTLDSYLRQNEHNKVDFIKIDVEGNEMKVLKGAIETLVSYKPVLMIEVFEDQLKRFDASVDDLFVFLKSLEYKVYTPDLSEVLTSEELRKITAKNIFAINKCVVVSKNGKGN